MIRTFLEIPLVGTFSLYQCDACGRRWPGWETQTPTGWAELDLSPKFEEVSADEAIVLHECRTCRRLWAEARLVLDWREQKSGRTAENKLPGPRDAGERD